MFIVQALICRRFEVTGSAARRMNECPQLMSNSPARLMAVALKLQTLGLPADKRKRLDALRAQAREANRAVEATQGTERAGAAERLIRLRQELLELVKDAAASDQTKRGSVLAQVHTFTRTGGVNIVPILTGVGGKLLVVTNGVGPSASRQDSNDARARQGGRPRGYDTVHRRASRAGSDPRQA